MTAPKPKKRNRYTRTAEAIAKHASRAREVYLADLATGMTIAEVAAKHGVSRQAVSQQTTGRRAYLARNREIDKVRRPATKYVPTCSACGQEGHHCDNAEFHPENASEG